MKTLLISGFSGRMGRECARLAPACGFASQAYRAGLPGDVLLDFSHPDCLPEVLACPLPLIIGTTGYSEEQLQEIRTASEKRPVFLAANFSPGIYALGILAEKVKELLPDWEISLTEIHHAGKKDTPSGTALRLADRLQIDQVQSIRGGTVRGVHEIGLYGPEEHLQITHTAESRAVFAHGALKAARWVMDKVPGLYGMKDIIKDRKQ
ncbi:MAG: 4-hydroxy-tetrahydrodipicolinate reductase [Clostridia bacterium]|nr:4-hydroxy-tetrahydrodipicolinate reductase [Clostridia bacterium]